MGNIFACGDYRKFKRSESIRETRTRQKQIQKLERIPNTVADVAERCTQTTETEISVSHTMALIEKSKAQTVDNVASEGLSDSETTISNNEICKNTTKDDTPVSQEVATIEKSNKQTGGDQETRESEGLEECVEKHKVKICNELENLIKMIKSLLPTENLNKTETSESRRELVDNSEKTKLLPDVKDIEECLKQQLESCNTLEQLLNQTFDDIKERFCTDAINIKTKNDIQDPRKSEEDLGRDSSKENKELKEMGQVHTEAKSTELQENKQTDSLQMKIEKCGSGEASAMIQFYNVQKGETMDQIKKNLKTYLDGHLKNVQFENCNSPNDIHDNHLLIIPCIITTRIGDDASHAIKNVPNPGKTVLVLIHNKEYFVLPKQNSSLTLTDKIYKNLCGIFDLAFTKDKGFYSCDMNSKNFDKLCKLCTETLGGKL